MKEMLLYVGSIVIVLWGVSHIVIPTKGVIDSFGPISVDNKRILVMEWIMEGLTLIFIGLLVILITVFEGVDNSSSAVVYRISAVMLILMALVSLVTGAKTKIIPMKLCPPIFTVVAVLYIVGSM